MTELLVRLFVRDRDNTGSPEVRMAYGNMAGFVGIVCNLLLSAGKFLAGLCFGSISIVADAWNNLTDASSNVITLLGFRLANKPADRNHPYGHGRYEYLAGLVVAMLVLYIGLELAKGSLDKILHPTPVEFSILSVCILTASILLKIWLAAFNRHIGKLIGSGALEATAADARNDVISTGSVLAASLISHFAHIELDGWMGMGVALFILYSGLGLLHETTSPLLGRAPDPELVHHVREKAASYPGVLGVHDLMIHDYGPGRQFASIHVEMPAERDVMESHEIIDTIEKDFHAEGLELVVHYDPVVTSDSQVVEARRKVPELVTELWQGRVTAHDIRLEHLADGPELHFDCVTPYRFEESDEEVSRKLCEAVHAWRPEYRCVILVERDYSPEDPVE